MYVCVYVCVCVCVIKQANKSTWEEKLNKIRHLKCTV